MNEEQQIKLQICNFSSDFKYLQRIATLIRNQTYKHISKSPLPPLTGKKNFFLKSKLKHLF